MEVKIKQGNELMDATIEMVDGVIVVAPKVEKFGPKLGEKYYHPHLTISNGDIVTTPNEQTFIDDDFCNVVQRKGWTFKTKEECKAFCNKLNDAINQVKP